jgi:hypothetical protein
VAVESSWSTVRRSGAGVSFIVSYLFTYSSEAEPPYAATTYTPVAHVDIGPRNQSHPRGFAPTHFLARRFGGSLRSCGRFASLARGCGGNIVEGFLHAASIKSAAVRCAVRATESHGPVTVSPSLVVSVRSEISSY